MRRLLMLLFVVVVVLTMVAGWNFAAANRETATVDFVFARFEDVPLWMILVLSFVAGASAATLLFAMRLLRASLAQRRYRKAVAALEAEVHQLRNLPVSEAGGGDAATPVEASAGAGSDGA